MKRREFIAGLGAAAWPVVARAQRAALPVVGFLYSGPAAERVSDVGAFIRGLKEAGFVEGQNVAIEYHWADGQYDRLPAMAAELVRRPVAVIAAMGGRAWAEAVPEGGSRFVVSLPTSVRATAS